VDGEKVLDPSPRIRLHDLRRARATGPAPENRERRQGVPEGSGTRQSARSRRSPPTAIQVPGAEQRFVSGWTAKPSCKARWVDRRHGVVESNDRAGTSSEVLARHGLEATIRASESDSGGADRRILFGAPAEVTGSARSAAEARAPTGAPADSADRCRRALMAIQAPARTDGFTLVVRTRPRQAESRVDDRSTDRTRPEWSVTERPREADRFVREVTRGLFCVFDRSRPFCEAEIVLRTIGPSQKPARGVGHARDARRAASLARQQYQAATER
jgi:hypothetical protein